MSEATSNGAVDELETEKAAVAEASPIFELLNGFVTELRNAGLPVSLSENLDAIEAVRHIPLEDRSAFKAALAATLVKNHTHWRSFETLFEVGPAVGFAIEQYPWPDSEGPSALVGLGEHQAGDLEMAVADANPVAHPQVQTAEEIGCHEDGLADLRPHPSTCTEDTNSNRHVPESTA